ncbi:unnamed protein product [Fraxinus pennsylvanica]|uniref:Uncharacterized protein n=1 Tax=Fraxinus pennsylvanica TaxID=56036 RepID=A0AAD1ZLY7_9LAMI|nr:unnamed protein product [Fraxinus pennsylvanica]
MGIRRPDRSQNSHGHSATRSSACGGTYGGTWCLRSLLVPPPDLRVRRLRRFGTSVNLNMQNKVLDEYQKNVGDSWKTVQADNTGDGIDLNDALTKFQDGKGNNSSASQNLEENQSLLDDMTGMLQQQLTLN